jgi:hypothetical protein
MVEDLIKHLRDQAAIFRAEDRLGRGAAKLEEAADLIEQQAARLTALESERDALLAAAGKEAVPVAWFIADDNGEVYRATGYEHERDQWRAVGHDVFPLYAAPEKPSDALYTMDQMRDYALAFHKSRLDARGDKAMAQGVFSPFNACMYRDECRARAALENGDGRDAWISVDERLPENDQIVAFVVKADQESPNWYLNGHVLGGTYHENYGFSTPGVGHRASHWRPLPSPPAALSQKAGEQQ